MMSKVINIYKTKLFRYCEDKLWVAFLKRTISSQTAFMEASSLHEYPSEVISRGTCCDWSNVLA